MNDIILLIVPSHKMLKYQGIESLGSVTKAYSGTSNKDTIGTLLSVCNSPYEVNSGLFCTCTYVCITPGFMLFLYCKRCKSLGMRLCCWDCRWCTLIPRLIDIKA